MVVAAASGWAATRTAARPVEISVARAEAMLAAMPKEDAWVKTPDASTLAWGESHFLHALVDLFEATDDAKYLTEIARRGDQLLSHRDDRRGVVDGSGKSRPAWSMASKYVVAEGALRDAAGRTVMTLRSTPTAYNNQTTVEVFDVSTTSFSLRINNAHFKREETFSNVGLAPADGRFVERIVNAALPTHSAKAGKFSEESNLVRVTMGERTAGMPVMQRITLRPIPLAYMGYLGVVYHPMLRFAEIVKTDARLADLRGAAERFVASADESYADATRRLWMEGPQAGEGYYLCCERGESFPFDNVGQPFNYLGRHTAAHLALFRLTGKAEYRERAVRMARLFKHRLKLDTAHELYTWNYWYEPVTTTGWSPQNSPSTNVPNYKAVAAVEDISHGVLDLALVLSAHEAGVVFDDGDLRRFANTVLTHVLTADRAGVNRRVDGSGGIYADYFPALAGWVNLAGANASVYREIRRAVEAAGSDNFQLVAALLKWERKLGALAVDQSARAK